MTDKVNAEVPSSFTGVIKELIAEEGDTLTVGEVICTIELDADGTTESLAADNSNTLPASKEEPTTQLDQSNKARYSPAVLKLSQEHGIDLTKVSGTGAGGRITRKDLLKLIESGQIPSADTVKETVSSPEMQEVLNTVPSQPTAVARPATGQVLVPTFAGDTEIPITGVRKAIASNMLRSKHEIPHAWTMIEVDVTNLVEYRNSLKDEFKKKEGFNLTFFAFLSKPWLKA